MNSNIKNHETRLRVQFKRKQVLLSTDISSITPLLYNLNIYILIYEYF